MSTGAHSSWPSSASAAWPSANVGSWAIGAGHRLDRARAEPEQVAHAPRCTPSAASAAGGQGEAVGVATMHVSRVETLDNEFAGSRGESRGVSPPDRRVEACLPPDPPARPGGRWPTGPSPGRSRPSPASTGSATPRAGSIYVGKAKNLRARLSSYFQDIAQPPPAHRHHGDHGGQRRVDGRGDRGRGAAAGVLLDQGVRPALQRQVPRRQVLPLAGGHGRRRVPAGDGRPRGQEEGHPLLRPLQPRLGDPGDRRPAAAGVPDALVHQRRLQAVRADRATVPARLHRQVLGTRASARSAPRTTAGSSTTSATSWAARRRRS